MIQIKTKQREPFFEENQNAFGSYSYTEETGGSNDGYRRSYSVTRRAHYQFDKVQPEQVEDGYVYNIDLKLNASDYPIRDVKTESPQDIVKIAKLLAPHLTDREFAVDNVTTNEMFSYANIRHTDEHNYSVNISSDYDTQILQDTDYTIALELQDLIMKHPTKEDLVQAIESSPLLSFILFNERATMYSGEQKVTQYWDIDWRKETEIFFPIVIPYSQQSDEFLQQLAHILGDIDLANITVQPNIETVASAIKDGTIPLEIIQKYANPGSEKSRCLTQYKDSKIAYVDDNNYPIVQAIIDTYPEYQEYYQQHLDRAVSKELNEKFGKAIDYNRIDVKYCNLKSYI